MNDSSRTGTEIIGMLDGNAHLLGMPSRLLMAGESLADLSLRSHHTVYLRVCSTHSRFEDNVVPATGLWFVCLFVHECPLVRRGHRSVLVERHGPNGLVAWLLFLGS